MTEPLLFDAEKLETLARHITLASAATTIELEALAEKVDTFDSPNDFADDTLRLCQVAMVLEQASQKVLEVLFGDAVDMVRDGLGLNVSEELKQDMMVNWIYLSRPEWKDRLGRF